MFFYSILQISYAFFMVKQQIFYDNMEGGIYIYENADDFLKAIRQIERFYMENDENSS